MPLDLTDDYLIFDGTETVTHLTTGGSSDSVTYALRQPLMIQDVGGAWVADATRTIWHLPAAQMANEPAPGHTITQGDGTRWKIDTADKLQLVGKWEITATKIPAVG